MSDNDLASWQGFAAAEMGAAAALLGLFFVAVSIQLRRVMASPELRGRARGCIAGLFVQLLVGIALIAPGQPEALLGSELFAMGGFSVWIALRHIIPRFRVYRPAREALLTNGLCVFGFLTIAIAGMAVIAGGYSGLRWLPLACAALFFFVIHGSWTMLAKASEEPA